MISNLNAKLVNSLRHAVDVRSIEEETKTVALSKVPEFVGLSLRRPSLWLVLIQSEILLDVLLGQEGEDIPDTVILVRYNSWVVSVKVLGVLKVQRIPVIHNGHQLVIDLLNNSEWTILNGVLVVVERV